METPTKQCRDCGAVLDSVLLDQGCPVCQMGLGLEEETAQETIRFKEYEVIEEIARGGMGIVYRARQTSLNRVVALKRLISGPFASRDFVARFRAEAQVLAQLQHPNIVTIYEIGEDAGQLFFAMELIDGHNLMETVRENPLPPQQAAQYVRSLADAVHYAHERGVLHRDLKPSNVLLDGNDTIKITDFGLSKTTGTDSHLTMTGQVLGTPSYVPPEQADPGRGETGAWSDIYSIGAILYHLLTGRPPFGSDTLENTLLQVLRSDPVAPRLLNPSIPRDLETVCMKCLEKEPAKRYATASDIAVELDRFLNDRPIHAKPAGAIEKGWRWCRRNPLLAGLAASLAFVFAGGFAATAWQWKRADAANTVTTNALRHMELRTAEAAFENGQPDLGLAYLARVLRKNPDDRVAAMRTVSALTDQTFPLPVFLPLRHEDAVLSVRYSSDGNLIATGSKDRTARIWNATTGEPLTEPLRHSAEVTIVEFDPTGRHRLLTASASGTTSVWETVNGNQADWNRIFKIRHQGRLNYAEFSPDGTLIVTASDDATAGIWNATTGEPVCPRLRHEYDVLTAKFDSSGARVVTASKDHLAKIWNARTGEPIAAAMEHKDGRVHFAEFSPDGSRVATASRDGTAQMWNASTGEAVGKPMSIGNWVMEARFSPDGGTLAVVGGANEVTLWKSSTAKVLDVLRHENSVQTARFSADGKMLATACKDGKARIWNLEKRREATLPMKHRRAVTSVDFSPDGKRIVSASHDGTAVVWRMHHVGENEKPIAHPGVARAYWSPDGSRILTTCDDGIARVFDSKTHEPVGKPMQHPTVLVLATYSPGGKHVATAARDGRRGDDHKAGAARIWNAETGELLAGPLPHSKMVTFVKFSPDGKWLASCSSDGTARVWDAATGKPVTPMFLHDIGGGERSGVLHLDFSPDSRQLLTASLNHSARIWNIGTGEAATALLHRGPVLWAEFSPDGSRIVTASGDATAQLWDTATLQRIGEPLEHESDVTRATFSPDGLLVVTASLDRTARVWDARNGEPLTQQLAHGDQVYAVGFSPDGSALVTGSNDGMARVWDSRTGHLLAVPMRHGHQGVITASFSPDGRRVLTGASGGEVRFWPLPATGKRAPQWFIDLTEAVAGRQIDAFDRSKRVELDRLVEIRSAISAMPSGNNDPWRKLADAFFNLTDTAKNP